MPAAAAQNAPPPPPVGAAAPAPVNPAENAAADLQFLEDLFAPSNKRTLVQTKYCSIGKAFGRTVNPFVNWSDILLTGFQMSIIGVLFEIPEDEGPDGPDLAHPLHNPLEARKYISWLLGRKASILRELTYFGDPEIMSEDEMQKRLELMQQRLEIIGSWLNLGISEGRGDDIKHAKHGLMNNFGLSATHDALGDFTFPLSKKSQLGYHNDRTGRLLVPMSMDWENEHDRNLLKQEGAIRFTGHEFFQYLWEGCNVDPNDLRKGFMLGEWIKRLFSRFNFGEAGTNNFRSRSHNTAAKKANLTSAEMPNIIYCAMIGHFVLQEEKNWGDGFPYQQYYRSLTDHFEKDSEAGSVRRILREYNREFFPSTDNNNVGAFPNDANLISAQPPPLMSSPILSPFIIPDNNPELLEPPAFSLPTTAAHTELSELERGRDLEDYDGSSALSDEESEKLNSDAGNSSTGHVEEIGHHLPSTSNSQRASASHNGRPGVTEIASSKSKSAKENRAPRNTQVRPSTSKVDKGKGRADGECGKKGGLGGAKNVGNGTRGKKRAADTEAEGGPPAKRTRTTRLGASFAANA